MIVATFRLLDRFLVLNHDISFVQSTLICMYHLECLSCWYRRVVMPPTSKKASLAWMRLRYKYTSIPTYWIDNEATFQSSSLYYNFDSKHIAPTRTVRQPEPMVVPRFHLVIPTPVRPKAGWAMRMIVACARAIAGLGEREIDREALRERDRRRWDGRTGLDERIHSERATSLEMKRKCTCHTRPSPTIRLRDGDSRMSVRTARGVSNAPPLSDVPCDPPALVSEPAPALLPEVSVPLVSMINTRSALARARIAASTVTSGLTPDFVGCPLIRLVFLLALTEVGDAKVSPMTMPNT